MTPEQLREQIHGQLPKSWLGITGALTAEEEKDLEAYYRHVRHTVNINRQPMTVEDETPPLRFSGAVVAWIAMGALLVGCLIGQLVLADLVGK